MATCYFSNERIKQIYIGTPSGHTHLRLFIQIDDDWHVFQEATIANLVRGYITITTHPHQNIIHMVQNKVKDQKQNFAPCQLMEANDSKEKLQYDVDQIWQAITGQNSSDKTVK